MIYNGCFSIFSWIDSYFDPEVLSLSYELLTHKCLPKLTIQLLLECSQAFGYPHSFGIATKISYSIVALDPTSLRKSLPNLQSNTANMRPLLCQCPKTTAFLKLSSSLILVQLIPIITLKAISEASSWLLISRSLSRSTPPHKIEANPSC